MNDGFKRHDVLLNDDTFWSTQMNLSNMCLITPFIDPPLIEVESVGTVDGMNYWM